MTTTDTGADTAPAETTTTPETPVDTTAELAKWKALAQKHEDRAKTNAHAVKELETLKQQSMSDTDKAVAAARTEGRIEAMKEAGAKLTEARIRVAAAGRNVDIDALIEGANLAKFIDSDGEPDDKAIHAWVDRVAPPVDDTAPAGRRDLGLGARGGQSTPALNSDPLLRDLKAKLGI